ncbi:hypothetical protein FACS1894196_1470 [Clostridia bacterium]|nr:hypothetical protein FACS1894196_1470 [Clostridia bacterium]
MKKIRTWGAMAMALALLVGACAALPLVSDWALASEEGKVTEHIDLQASFVNHTGVKGEEPPPRELTEEEAAFVEKARQKLIETLGEDPQQPGYAVQMIDISNDTRKWINVTWRPTDFEQRLLDAKAEPFRTYAYVERNDEMLLVDIGLYGIEDYDGWAPDTEEGKAMLKWILKDDGSIIPIILTEAEQALVDDILAKQVAQRAQFDQAEPHMRELADAMLAKLGHQDAQFVGDDVHSGSGGLKRQYIYQVAEGVQVGIVVSFEMDMVCAVEYGENVIKG